MSRKQSSVSGIRKCSWHAASAAFCSQGRKSSNLCTPSSTPRMRAVSAWWLKAWTECAEPVVACAPQASLSQRMARAHRAPGARIFVCQSLAFAKRASKSHSHAPNAMPPRKARSASWRTSALRKSRAESARKSCAGLATRNAWQPLQQEPRRPASVRSVASGNAALTSSPL